MSTFVPGFDVFQYPDLHPPNRILLFTITNVVYPVNVSMIAQVCRLFSFAIC